MRKVRSLLSVLLVCCLLVNVVPVKSKAVGATAAVVGVSAAMVAASALIGLGVSPGEDSSVFTGIVQNLVDGLEAAGYVAANGLINVFSIGKGDFKYGISQIILDFVRNWMWDSSVVESSTPNYFDSSKYSRIVNGSIWGDVTIVSPLDFWISGYIYKGRDYFLIVTAESSWFQVFYSSGSTTDSRDFYINSGYNGVFYKASWNNASSAPSYKHFGDLSSICSSSDAAAKYVIDNYFPGFNSFVCSQDISLEFIGDNALSISDAYTDWASNSTTIPAEEAGKDEDVIVYPIGLGPDYDNTISKPQEDVWAGTSEYEIEAEGDSEAGTGTETGFLSSILSAVKSIPSAFEGWFTDLIDLAGEIGEAIIGLPARIKEALTSLFQDVVNVGQAVVDAVLGIPQAIADVLTAIFVPDQAYVESKVDAVYAQFPFIQSIIATGEELKGAVSGSSGPPVIYVDLGLAPSGDFGQQKVLLTDFSWYEPYKQRVDTLLSAALWALFGWRMYLRLPSIISGEGGIMIASERAYRKLGDD